MENGGAGRSVLIFLILFLLILFLLLIFIVILLSFRTGDGSWRRHGGRNGRHA